jgi:hypothetical protein
MLLFLMRIDAEVAEKSSWDPAKERRKFCFTVVWRKRKKISQIINDYLYFTVLPLNNFMPPCLTFSVTLVDLG